MFRNVILIASYGLNWLVALGGRAGSGLSHLWSLSVEEQFYLVWPALLLLALRIRVPAPIILTLSLALVVVSASVPAMLSNDWTRLYYGTDFRLQGLMLGSVMGQLYVVGALKPSLVRAPSFQAALVLAALLLVLVVLLDKNHAGMLFHGGHTLVAICSAILIVGALFREGNPFAAVLSNPVLVYIGRRSYALYLWHAAINVWFDSLDSIPHFFLTIAMSFLAAELSYRLVERPALSFKARLGDPSQRSSHSETDTDSGARAGSAA